MPKRSFATAQHYNAEVFEGRCTKRGGIEILAYCLTVSVATVSASAPSPNRIHTPVWVCRSPTRKVYVSGGMLGSAVRVNDVLLLSWAYHSAGGAVSHNRLTPAID